MRVDYHRIKDSTIVTMAGLTVTEEAFRFVRHYDQNNLKNFQGKYEINVRRLACVGLARDFKYSTLVTELTFEQSIFSVV